MTTEAQRARDCADDLCLIADAYPLLFAFKQPSRKRDCERSGTTVHAQPPVNFTVIILISDVEELACWVERTCCELLDRPWVDLDSVHAWDGAPNPYTAPALCRAAGYLPAAVTAAGADTLAPLVTWVASTKSRVEAVMGPSAPAELIDGECPGCGSLHTVVRTYTPHRLRCVLPQCGYEHSLEMHDAA